MENTKLSNHFTLDEFLNVSKYPDNKPTMQHSQSDRHGVTYGFTAFGVQFLKNRNTFSWL